MRAPQVNGRKVSPGPFVVFNSLAHERQEVVCLRTRSFKLTVKALGGKAEPPQQQIHAHYVYQNGSMVQDSYEVGEFKFVRRFR